MKRFFCSIPLFLTITNLLAQTATPDDAATAATTATASPDAAAAAAGGMAAALGGGICCFVWVALWVALWLGIAIWVMKDAKKRQSPNATLVTVLAWIPVTTVVGLIVHLVTRPKTIPGETNLPPTA